MAFARTATIDPSEVPQEVLLTLKNVLTPPQIIELACVVGFWKFYNTIHEALYIPLEDVLIDDDGMNSDALIAEKEVGASSSEVKAAVEIYSKDRCPFCRRAKRLLTARGAAFTAHDIDTSDENLQDMLVRSGGVATVPQIFINGEWIGGMDQLSALDQAGKLAEKLAASPTNRD